MTKDDVLKETTSNPTLKTELLSSFKDEFTENLKAEGIILRTAEEEKRFLQNYEKTVIPDKVKVFETKVAELHNQYDNDLLELTGEKRPSSEKTPEFLKRKINELKAKQRNDSDPVLADKLKDLEAKLKEREDWVPADKITELETKYFSEGIQSRISSTLDKRIIAVPAHITEEKAKQEYATAQRNMIKTDYLNTFTAKKDNDGNIVYYLGGQIQTNTQTGKPLTETELIDKRYPAYFAPEQKVKTGAGSGKGGKANVDVNEASLKTKAEVIEYLNKKFELQGIKRGNPAYNKEYTRILTDYGLTE